MGHLNAQYFRKHFKVIAKTAEETDAEYKAKIKRNVEHLETIKAYKKEDGSTSIWTSENFTAIDAAITSGKSKYE